MPAEVTREPLGIACTFSDGTSARFALGGLPCPELARDLLTGLAELVHPHGTVDAAGSVEHYVASVRHMARQLDAAGFSGDASGLRRAQAARYWMAAPGPREACTRRMLQGFQTAGGTLDAGVAELAAGRAFNPQRNHRQLPPYSETEWARLASTCESVADESFAAHRQALAAASRAGIPVSTAGAGITCAGCWPGRVLSASLRSGSTWAARTTWSASEAGCWRPAGTCSRAWTW